MNFILSLIILTNSARISPLKVDADLNKRAQTRAEFLCRKNQWSHDGWKDSFVGTSSPYIARFIGENLARNYTDATSTQNAWMASPTHKTNIVSTNYKYVGFGHVASTTCNLTVGLFRS
jgi:uncharacterized protein YkwD